MYIQVILDKYFDKNEFYIGDQIIISGFKITRPKDSTTHLYDMDFNGMQAFINRPEGHDIVQISEANSNGFYKSFYILAPGELDQQQGKLIINKQFVDALREYNTLTTIINTNKNGSVINMSLQVTISMTISTNVGNTSIITSTPI